jgi:molecular chaperone GrpE
MGDETNHKGISESASTPSESGQAQPSTPAANERAIDSHETMPSLQELLKQAELKATEHYDAWLRAKAETDNAHKRAQQDIANARKYALESFAAELLSVKDSLEAALAVENATSEALKSGVELTLKQLASVFERFKIGEINPLGEKFDPHKHQAISMVESEAAPNTVVAVLQKGYALHERVLRAAMVSVAKARAGNTPSEDKPAA